MDDLISRQAAIDAIHCDITVIGKENAETVARTIGEFVDRIKALPPAQPEREEGEWINTNPEYKNGFYNNSYYCSECHDYYTTSPYEMKFCPNCGARMKGANDI